MRTSHLKRSCTDHTAFTLQKHHTCLYLVSVYQTVPPLASGSSHLITAYNSFVDLLRILLKLVLSINSSHYRLHVLMSSRTMRLICALLCLLFVYFFFTFLFIVFRNKFAILFLCCRCITAAGCLELARSTAFFKKIIPKSFYLQYTATGADFLGAKGVNTPIENIQWVRRTQENLDLKLQLRSKQ